MTDVVGFIGAGKMGEPMVLRLLDAGHRVVVYARRDEVKQRLKSRGASVADSVADVAGASDVLITCLFSDTQLTGDLESFATIVAPFLRKDVAACVAAAEDAGVDLVRFGGPEFSATLVTSSTSPTNCVLASRCLTAPPARSPPPSCATSTSR